MGKEKIRACIAETNNKFFESKDWSKGGQIQFIADIIRAVNAPNTKMVVDDPKEEFRGYCPTSWPFTTEACASEYEKKLSNTQIIEHILSHAFSTEGLCRAIFTTEKQTNTIIDLQRTQLQILKFTKVQKYIENTIGYSVNQLSGEQLEKFLERIHKHIGSLPQNTRYRPDFPTKEEAERLLFAAYQDMFPSHKNSPSHIPDTSHKRARIEYQSDVSQSSPGNPSSAQKQPGSTGKFTNLSLGKN